MILLQEMRAAASNIEPKHEKEIVSLIDSYKSLYSRWVFMLRYGAALTYSIIIIILLFQLLSVIPTKFVNVSEGCYLFVYFT